MKKLNILVIILMTFLLNITNVFAENCDSKTQVEINTAAANVTMNYEIQTKVVDMDGNIHDELDPDEVEVKEVGSLYYIDDFISVNVNNISDKIYVVFKSVADNINKEYHYEDTDNGSFTYNLGDNSMTKDFTLTIYSNVGNCVGNEVNKIEITTPKYNIHSDEMICQNNDAYYCKKYVTSDVEIPDEEYGKYAENGDINNEEERPIEKNNNKNLYLLIGGSVVIVVLIILIIVTVIKNKRKRDMLNIGGGVN